MPEVERRRTSRVRMSLPVTVADESAGIQIHVTRDVSLSGVSLFSTTVLPVGTAVAFTFVLPPEIMLDEPVRAHCKGRVVRLEPQPDGRGFVIALRQTRLEAVALCADEVAPHKPAAAIFTSHATRGEFGDWR